MTIEINLGLKAAFVSAPSLEKLGPNLDKHNLGAVTGAVSDGTGYRSAWNKHA